MIYAIIMRNAITDSLACECDTIQRAKEAIHSVDFTYSKPWNVCDFCIQNVEALTATYDNIVGDVLLSAGMVAYMGAFILDYRQVRFYVDLLCWVNA